MNKIKIKNILSLVFNILTAVLVTVAVRWFFTDKGLEAGAGNMKSGGVACFTFFTIDSNILAALCSLLVVPFNIKSLRSGKNEIPKIVTVLKFVGAVAVTVTFTVVLFFLGPILGYNLMFEGNCFTLHLISPVLAIISFCFFEKETVLSKKQALWGIIPTAVYATIYLVNVIFTGVWSDFYHFNIGGFWYLSYVVMIAVTYFLSLAIAELHNIKRKSRSYI